MDSVRPEPYRDGGQARRAEGRWVHALETPWDRSDRRAVGADVSPRDSGPAERIAAAQGNGAAQDSGPRPGSGGGREGPPPPPAPPEGGGDGPGAPRRRVTRVVLAVGLALLLVAGTSVGALLWYGRASLEQTAIEGIAPKTDQRRSVTLADGETIQIMNVLVVGTDNPASLTPEQQAMVAPDADRRSGRRPDTIMLAQLQVGGGGAALMSIPRDLRVELCDGSTNKINAAYSVAARADKTPESCLVTTITRITGLEIDHFVEVDFGGFLRVIDALGGVTMYFEQPMIDSKAHVDIPAGCVTLTPEQALGFVRSRGYDDDFGRIARQQRFVKEVVDEVTRVGVLANPRRVVALVDRAAKSVKTDDQLNLGEMRELAQGLRSLTSSSVIAHTVPADHAMIDGVAYVVADDGEAEALYASFRDSSVLRPVELAGDAEPVVEPEPEPTTPSAGEVPPIVVLNGTGVGGLAGATAEMLEAHGFRIATVGNAEDTPVAATQVQHGTALEAEAALLAGVFGDVDVTVQTGGAPLTLVLGEDVDPAAIEALVPAEGEPEPTPTAAPTPTTAPTPTPTVEPTPTAEPAPQRTFRGTERTEDRC